MDQLIEYIHKEFGVSRPGDVTWSHAVNSQEKLERYVHDTLTMFIESDIRCSLSGIPVAAHPPETESDLTFDMLIDTMRESKQGLKLDFKDPEILTVCLEHLQKNPLSQPVLLNADILQGNGANPSKFDAHDFISQCKNYYPAGILSLGWTTTTDPELWYTEQNVDDMLSLCEDREEITFPVRACLLPASWNALERLLEKDGYTLTIWNNEPVSEDLIHWIREHTNPDKTFYDFIDENKEPLRLM